MVFDFNTIVTLLAAVAAVKIAAVLVSGAAALLGSGERPTKYGKWAVVTGATDGIGLAYAKELAKKKMNVVLISRTASRLEESKKTVLEAAPGAEVKTIQADFNDTSDEFYARIAADLAGLDIGILVNNVGVSYNHAAFLTELDDARAKALVDVNVTATVRMTRIVLPGMEARKRGCILNVASAAGVLPSGDPLYAVYSASKAFVDFFSRSLHHELKAKNIFVQCQVPYFVQSKLSKIRRTSLLVPSPATYAKAALTWIGRGGASVVPYAPHALQHFLMCSLPGPLLAYLVLSHHHGIRKRALAKKAKSS